MLLSSFLQLIQFLRIKICLFYTVQIIFIFGVDQYSEKKKCVTKIVILPYFCRGIDVDRKAFVWVLQGANFVSGLESGSKHCKCTGKWIYASGDDGKVQDFITDKPTKIYMYVIRLHIPKVPPPTFEKGWGWGVSHLKTFTTPTPLSVSKSDTFNRYKHIIDEASKLGNNSYPPYHQSF